jgi:hypothetical protein
MSLLVWFDRPWTENSAVAASIPSKMIGFIGVKSMTKTLVDPLPHALYERDKSHKVEARRALVSMKRAAVA